MSRVDNPGIHAIRVDSPNGTWCTPVVILESDPDWRQQLLDASRYFKKDGRVTTITSDDIYDTGADKTTPQWEIYRERLFDFDETDQTQNFLKDMNKRKVAAWVIDTVQKDLQFQDNEKSLVAHIDLLENKKDQEMMKMALRIAKDAHAKQTQKRPQDAEGLDNIPYVNHPIQVANMAIQLKMSPVAIQAALLHDVVEDTDITMKDLENKGFSRQVLEILADLTRQLRESRKEYMQRVSHLTPENPNYLSAWIATRIY